MGLQAGWQRVCEQAGRESASWLAEGLRAARRDARTVSELKFLPGTQGYPRNPVNLFQNPYLGILIVDKGPKSKVFSLLVLIVLVSITCIKLISMKI